MKRHYPIMRMRYFRLAILAATAATTFSQNAPESAENNSNDMTRQLVGDWDIQPEDGYPIIGFDDTNEENEVVFKYNFTGTPNNRKFLDVNLYQNDCVSASDDSLAFINSTSGDELDINIDVIQETIANSVHYQDINGASATIGFCLRVDYNYVDDDGLVESINFYETNVTINVDLTAGFTLTGINVFRIVVGNETTAEADLAYPVEAYICLDDNSGVENPEPLTQGSTLQVCVKIDDTVVTENVLVEDILSFVIFQPDGTATYSESITNTVSDFLTDKVCRESGICNVKTQLQSKFFTDINPGDLRVEGVAILAFGKASLMPSSAPTVDTVRRLRAPIRGLLSASAVKSIMTDQQKQRNNNNNNKETAIVSAVADSSQRMLQDGTAQSGFGLGVGLQGIRDDVSGQGAMILQGNSGDASSQGESNDDGEGGPNSQGTDDEGELDIVVIVVVVTVSAAGCCLFFCLCARRRRREEREEIIRHRSSSVDSHSDLGYNDSAARAKTHALPSPALPILYSLLVASYKLESVLFRND
jgi:hypothetical protein